MIKEQVQQVTGAMNGKTVAIVGGGSGIGRAIAQAVSSQGGKTVLSSRTVSKLHEVASSLDDAMVVPVDMTDSPAVERWAASVPMIDHLVISASSAAHGSFAELDEGALRTMFDAKFFGPYRVAKAALSKLKDGGSITFFSGVLSRRPGMNCSGLGAVNGAVESLIYGLALELGPRLRVNCVSPGMIISDAYAGMDERARQEMYEATGESLPVGRVGTVEEAAMAAQYLMTNTYSTGVVLDVDGGHMIRQYAKR
ncbi:MAG: SDR family oxidoreductase [Pseudomonadota bacterium]